jgi:L-2-hydroxycarboxylate dehydrogenase (NAD+)
VLVARMQAGLIVPDSTPHMTWRSESVLSVDGARGFGPVVAQRALEVAVERARVSGIALVAISNTNHLGILAPYVEGVAAKGLTCIALTTSEALVHPWGGRDAMVGTNPLAIGIPADPAPLVLDMATSQVSMGKVIHYSQLGKPLEPGWAVDKYGEPTTDPEVALEGSISPFGGAKGFALGLAFEVLVGSLTNSALGPDIHGTLDAMHVCNKGDVFICIDQTVVTGVSRSVDVSRYLADVRSTPKIPGSTGVRIPGERAREERASREAKGVEIAIASWDAAVAIGSRITSSPMNPDPFHQFGDETNATASERRVIS